MKNCSRTAIERRQELLDALDIRRHDTVANLAAEFEVSERTIRRDLEILTSVYPLETRKGRYCGGVYVPEWFHLHHKYLNDEQINLLNCFMKDSSGEDKRILKSRLNYICVKKLGIVPKSPHKIRKTYASCLIDAHLPDSLIIEQMGHTDIETTKKHYYDNHFDQNEIVKLIGGLKVV